MKKTAAVILKEYFGYLPGQKLQAFGEELKALAPAEKLELARLAATELGCELDEPAPALVPVGA